tara:strand:+ start:36 stop:566 length:531 start_codon:yes stop_codon:yes gene_type:complete
MKKLILLITLFITGATFAQIEKPTDGKIFEIMFTPNTQGGEMFNLYGTPDLEGHLVMRTFDDATSVTRWKAHFSYQSIDGVDDDNMVLGLFYGKEKHHEGTDRLATYTGWEAGLYYSDVNGVDSTTFGGGVFVGANYYIANNLYIGTEIGYGVGIGEDVTNLDLAVNGMLTLGFKL